MYGVNACIEDKHVYADRLVYSFSTWGSFVKFCNLRSHTQIIYVQYVIMWSSCISSYPSTCTLCAHCHMCEHSEWFTMYTQHYVVMSSVFVLCKGVFIPSSCYTFPSPMQEADGGVDWDRECLYQRPGVGGEWVHASYGWHWKSSS